MASKIQGNLSNQVLIRLLLFFGLAAFTMAMVYQQLVVALGIAVLPIVLAVGLYGLSRPHVIYFIYAVYACTFITIMRYTRTEGLSVVLDILLVYVMVSMLCSSYIRDNIHWKRAINILTISYIPWIFFTLFQFLNPLTRSDSMMTGLRAWIGETIALYLMVSILSDHWKALKVGMLTLSIFVFACFLKVLWQRYVGFDSAEQHFLYVQGAQTTHIIHSGIRYFSFISDAATFGTLMSTAALVYGLAALKTPNRRLALWFAFIAVTSFMGQLLSGTRGSLIIPALGVILYTLLCKNVKIAASMLLLGLSVYFFFAFTHIGDSNPFIKRARTAFHPSQDASMNVRLNNRELIADYMEKNPFGAGIGHMVPTVVLNDEGQYVDDIIPSDSYYVGIWSQTGYIGLFLLIAIHGLVILVCCYKVMFHVHNDELRQTLMAFTCAVFGIYASGYTSYSPGQPPINFLIPAMLAFVLNGPSIDAQLQQASPSPSNSRKPNAI